MWAFLGLHDASDATAAATPRPPAHMPQQALLLSCLPLMSLASSPPHPHLRTVDVTGASTISLAPAPALAAAANLVTLDPGFERGTQSVLDCKEAVRSLTAEANKARSYREKCSQVRLYA